MLDRPVRALNFWLENSLENKKPPNQLLFSRQNSLDQGPRKQFWFEERDIHYIKFREAFAPHPVPATGNFLYYNSYSDLLINVPDLFFLRNRS